MTKYHTEQFKKRMINYGLLSLWGFLDIVAEKVTEEPCLPVGRDMRPARRWQAGSRENRA